MAIKRDYFRCEGIQFERRANVVAGNQNQQTYPVWAINATEFQPFIDLCEQLKARRFNRLEIVAAMEVVSASGIFAVLEDAVMLVADFNSGLVEFMSGIDYGGSIVVPEVSPIVTGLARVDLNPLPALGTQTGGYGWVHGWIEYYE